MWHVIVTNQHAARMYGIDPFLVLALELPLLY